MSIKYDQQLQIEALNKQIFDTITSTVSAEDFIKYYINHNQKETLEHFGIRNIKQLKKILIYFNYDFSTKKPNRYKGLSSPRSHESYIKGGEKSSRTQKQHWEEKSELEKQAWAKKQSLAHLNSSTFKSKITASNRAFRASLTPEEKQRMDEARSKSVKNWWASLSTKEKEEILARRFKNGTSYHQKDSAPNLAFMQLLMQLGLQPDVDFQREICLDRKFFDFKIGSDLLVEIDPTFTHNSSFTPFEYNQPLDKYYHRDKTKVANKHNFRCIHIFDWEDPTLIAKMLCTSRPKIFARQCEIKEVEKEAVKDFLVNNHIQGYANYQIALGLYYKNELVSLMSFGKPRYNKNYQYELIRYCATYNIVGGVEKLFTHFVTQFRPDSIVSYCDLSKFNGDTYIKLNFKLLRTPSPSKHWYNMKTKEHYTDALVRQHGFSRIVNHSTAKEDALPTNDNRQLMLNAGFVEVYDCGQATFVWHS